MRWPFVLPALLLVSWSAPAPAAATCKYVDADGRVTFANVPIRNARKVMCFEPVPDTALAPRQGANAPQRKSAPDNGASLRVDPETQRRRDQDRRRILEEELAEERRLLTQATAAVQSAQGSSANAPAQQEQLRSLQEALARHERNIEAIQRELASIR